MPSTYIDREECIGDSLVKLNSNFSGLDADISNLNTRVTNLSAGLLPSYKSLFSRSYTFYIQWSYSGNRITFGAPYEASNPAFPGGNNYAYTINPNTAAGFKFEDVNMPIYVDSYIAVTFTGYANFDGTTNDMNTQIAFDTSTDNGSTWANAYTLAYGISVPNAGSTVGGGAVFAQSGNSSLKIRPKMRFQNGGGSTAPNAWSIYGNLNVSIEPQVILF